MIFLRVASPNGSWQWWQGRCDNDDFLGIGVDWDDAGGINIEVSRWLLGISLGSSSSSSFVSVGEGVLDRGGGIRDKS